MVMEALGLEPGQDLVTGLLNPTGICVSGRGKMRGHDGNSQTGVFCQQFLTGGSQ